MLEPIKNRLKELKANNKEAVKLFWQSRDLINLLRITSNLKQIEKENLKIENLIKENKSKTEVTKELKSNIEKINKIFENANNALKDDIMYCKNHIEKEGQNNTFYVDEFKILVKNLKSAFGKYKKSKEKLDLLTKEIGKNKVELEKKYNEKINEIKDVLEQQNWDKYDAIKIEETIRELDYIKNAIISLKKEDKEARTTYYKANSLKKLLNAKKEYMNGVELDNEAANLRKTIESDSEKNIIDKDINEKIEKINKKIDEARVKISENNKECNKFISQKDKPYVYFAKEIKAQLNKLNDIDKSLQETKENLNKAPKTAINKILKNMENEAKYLKREYERLKEVYYDNDKDDEIYEEDLDDFYVDLEKFENDYKGNYENIKKLDKDSAETLRGIYKDARTKHLIEKF